uniref:Uncharacterized protein n=1 Tax=Timema tahoe TaxID=61484 RepID=A0A7R9IPX6_9NEOP|nr:unnamed protein product [Timema tahoe]
MRLRPLALSSASLKPILWDGGREGERRGVVSQPTKVSFHANKNRLITETVTATHFSDHDGIHDARQCIKALIVSCVFRERKSLCHASRNACTDNQCSCSSSSVSQASYKLLLELSADCRDFTQNQSDRNVRPVLSRDLLLVCNAVYVRLNTTQPLCACPNRYRDPCSASLSSDDLHTTELVMESKIKALTLFKTCEPVTEMRECRETGHCLALTLVKTCEPVTEMRECRAPRDWSLLALQNIRTGKSHYLVVCRCPHSSVLEGPIVHDQPTYASVPGIRVYGMVCVPKRSRRSLILGRKTRPVSSYTRRLMEDILREQV